MTSHIQSKVSSVDDLIFHPLPTKPLAVSKAVRVDRVHVFVDARGRVYSTQIQDRCSYSRGCEVDETLRGCILLGVLTPAAVEAHVKDGKALELARRNKYAAEAFVDAAEALGLRLTAAQQSAINKAKGVKAS